jgi:predicted ATPase
MGFGFSQILPIITQLWVLSNKKVHRSQKKTPIIFTIEQPELHLHPKLQAQLADTLLSTVGAAKQIGLDLRLIIETHSETIINRIGHRISNGNYSSDDVAILVFNKDMASTVVESATFDKNGFLHNWPYGFFDPEMV